MEYRPYQWQGEDHDSHVRYFYAMPRIDSSGRQIEIVREIAYDLMGRRYEITSEVDATTYFTGSTRVEGTPKDAF
jgi:hypothetical protein